jgi:glycerol kinase
LIRKNNNDKDAFRKICGLPINTYFSAVKIKWMIENVQEISAKIENKDYHDLCFGTIDTWLVYVKLILTKTPKI